MRVNRQQQAQPHSNYLPNSVAPVIGSVIGKTIYRLVFVYWYRIGTTMKTPADTDMCMY